MKKISQQAAYAALPIMTLISAAFQFDATPQVVEFAVTVGLLSLLPLLAITFGMPREPAGKRTPDAEEFLTAMGWSAFGSMVLSLFLNPYSTTDGVLWGPLLTFIAIGALAGAKREGATITGAMTFRALMLSLIGMGVVMAGMYVAYMGVRTNLSRARFAATLLSFAPFMWIAMCQSLRTRPKARGRLGAFAMVAALGILLPGTSLHHVPNDMTLVD